MPWSQLILVSKRDPVGLLNWDVHHEYRLRCHYIKYFPEICEQVNQLIKISEFVGITYSRQALIGATEQGLLDFWY